MFSELVSAAVSLLGWLTAVFLSCPTGPLLCVGVSTLPSVFSCSYEDPSSIGLGPHTVTSFNPNYLLKGPISKFSLIWGEHTSIHSTSSRKRQSSRWTAGHGCSQRTLDSLCPDTPRQEEESLPGRRNRSRSTRGGKAFKQCKSWECKLNQSDPLGSLPLSQLWINPTEKAHLPFRCKLWHATPVCKV